MRILVVPKWYPWADRPVFGIFCREQARALAGEHDVVVLASDAVRSPPFRVFELSDGIEDGLRTVRVRYRRPRFRPAAIGCQLAGMLVAVARLRREGWRPDIVHAHVYSAALPALVLGRLCRARVVVTEHYTGFYRGSIRGYDRFTARVAFRFADLVAPVSHDLAREVLAIQPRARVRVVENVVDAEVFHPPTERQAPTDCEPRRDRPARLLTVGSLAEKKGHVYLLEALARLQQHRRVTLDLVGDGELRADLEARAQALGLGDVVRFQGERPQPEVAELMRSADLFVLPSLFETSSVVLIEATASGLPAVASAVGGVPEVLDGTGGILCPARDSEALARALDAGLERSATVDSAALAAHARARFSYATFERTWTEIYSRLRAAR